MTETSEGVENNITQGTVLVTSEENGKENQYEIPVMTAAQKQTVSGRESRRSSRFAQMAARLQGARITVDANGALTWISANRLRSKK